ncbi:T9SS type A sorting domain-containing protein [Chryseobacterium sp. MMS23-Vi53]|uniref:T9SS type A sorting domain-containing protein n=1 Tax=Chryseobacterium sp. MMS23-Vi53 TaxID=3386644 RepID=UPI0039ED8F23
MKNNTICRWLLMLFCLLFANAKVNAQYTSVYNNVTYTSTQPYNLNVVYFVPNDVPLDTTYKKRLSEMLIWAQNFYKQNMIANGFGPKTFGLYKEATNPNNVKIIVIHGTRPILSYPYEDMTNILQEVNSYFTNNPSQKTAARSLIFTAGKNSNSNVAFVGLGLNCFAIDYPGFDLQYLNIVGVAGDFLRSRFGGMLHELGHGLGLPHSHQTITENNDPTKGMNLMFAGNGTIGTITPTFINRAGCAFLNNSELFSSAPGGTYRNGNTSRITSLNTSFDNGNLVVTGTFESNRTVTDVNIYQDPFATPSAGYYKVAWSVKPVGNTFTASMPVSDLENINSPYNLQIDLILNNEETSFSYYPFNYNNGIPDFENSTFVGESITLKSAAQGVGYQWQYKTATGWENYNDGSSFYGNFSGTKTNTLTISNVSSAYVNSPDTSRLAITQANGSIIYSTPQTWYVYNIESQPTPMTYTCVGGSVQLSAQATGTDYQWQYQTADGAWANFQEGNIPGYATFSGTKTKTLTISNISGVYANTIEKARLLVYGKNGRYKPTNTAQWQINNVTITNQPPVSLVTGVNGSLTISASASGASNYQWQFQDSNGNWNNYTEGAVSGYATFSGTKTPTLTISNISGAYVNPEKSRLLAIGARGCTAASNPVTWRADNVSITKQPAVLTTGCVGGTLSIPVEASQAVSYQWQYLGSDGIWRNYTEGTIAGYGTFTGTKSSTLTVSNIGGIYTSHDELARLLVYGTTGYNIGTITTVWKVTNCTGKTVTTSKNNKSITDKPVNEIDSKDSQSVYPNPVQDELNVNLGSGKNNYLVQIYNAAGQMIYQITTSERTLKVPFSDKPTANYLVVIKNTSNGSSKSFKVIKK